MIGLKIEELEVAAFLQDIDAAASMEGKGTISGVISDYLPSDVSAQNIHSLLSGNHELSWILQKAERICQGNDGGTGSSGQSHLESIVASASFFDKEGVSAYLPLQVHDSESCIPSNEDQYSAGELIDALSCDIPKLGSNKDFVSFFAAMDSMLEHYCSSIPSLSSGVSLYQRAKTKTAIASSIYSYVLKAGIDEENFEESCPFILISGDATGIQKYIFGVNTYKFSAKIIRARSFQIWIQSFLIAGHICRSLGLTAANIISFSGGKFLLLLPNIPELGSMLDDIRCRIDNLCIDAYSGEIAYVISRGVTCSAEDLDAKDSAMLQRRIRLDTADAKQKKLQEGINGRQTGAVLEEQYSRLQKSDAVCVSCESNAAENSEGFCHDCSYLIELGRLLNKPGFSIFLNFGIIAGLDKTVKILKSGENIPNYLSYAISRYVPGMARISMPYYVPMEEDGDVLTFEDIAAKAAGIKKLAMFKADVDYLGLIFSSSLKDRWSLSRYAALSSAFHFYFSENLLNMIRNEFPDLYVVFSGGDDVCVIGPWNNVMEFAERFNKSFHEFTADNPSLTVSAGITMFNPHDAIPAVAEEAEEALEESKDAEDKNSITLFSRTVSWAEYSCQLADSVILAKMHRISKSGFLYRILTYSDNAYSLADENIAMPDISKALWLSHYTYSLKRNEIKDKECQNVLISYKKPEKMRNAKIAATIALYANRGGK